MSKTSRAQYNEQLGEDVGTAQGRLLKMLLFHYAIDSSHLCYKCGDPIESWEELSVDHVNPWRHEDNARELFWDLNNIAFTHRKCNKPDRQFHKQCPEGTSWCGRCKSFKPVADFSKNSARTKGLSSTCRVCDNERVRKYAERNPRFACPECGTQMRKKCPKCKWELPMKDYMALRRKEGVEY